jgi:hypothetical protein
VPAEGKGSPGQKLAPSNRLTQTTGTHLCVVDEIHVDQPLELNAARHDVLDRLRKELTGVVAE